MPKEKPKFKLHVDGKEGWSWADIEPNWVYIEDDKPTTASWNENSRELMIGEEAKRVQLLEKALKETLLELEQWNLTEGDEPARTILKNGFKLLKS